MALVISALVATAIWFLLPPAKPTVAAKIDITAKRPSLFGPNPLLDSGSSISPERQAALVKSRLVLNAALKNPKVLQANPSVLRDRDALSWLEQEIKVDFPDGPEIFRVSMVGDQSDELIILVDAVVDAYINEFLEDQTKSLNARIQKMRDVLKLHEDRRTGLETKRNDLALFVGAGQDKGVEVRQERAQKWILFEESELLKTRAEKAKLEREQRFYTRVVKDGGGIPIPESLVDTQIETKPAMRLLRAQEAQLIEIIAKRAAADGEDSIVVKKHMKSHDQVLRSIEETRQRLRPEVEQELRTKAGAEAKARLGANNAAIRELNELEEAQKKRIEKLQQQAHKVNTNSLGMESLNRDIKQADASLTRIATKLDELTAEAGAPARVRKLEDAAAFQPDELPRKLRFAGIGAASTFALVLLLAAYLGFRSRLI